MTTYSFETITAAQALAFGSADILTLPTGSSAPTTTVLYLPDGNFSMMVGSQTVIFNSSFPSYAQKFRFPDDSTLFVGGASADLRNAGTQPSKGAMYGGDGGDTLTGASGDWFMQGNQGNDRIDVQPIGANIVYGGQGDDKLSMLNSGAGDKGQFLQGNKGDDTLQGGTAFDTLLGGQGNDFITGVGGSDFMNGNLGDDQLFGNGLMFGEGGNDRINVGTGLASTASGGDGDDYIQIGSDGRGHHTVAFGNAGNDTIGSYASNSDELDGGDGDDLIQFFNTNFGEVVAGAIVNGGSGRDTVRGANGADTINGGSGVDALNGGGGVDVFILQDRLATNAAADLDRILDWASEDRIDLAGSVANYSEATASDLASALLAAKDAMAGGRGGVAVVQIPDGVLIIQPGQDNGADAVGLLVGRTLADIAQDNFI